MYVYANALSEWRRDGVGDRNCFMDVFSAFNFGNINNSAIATKYLHDSRTNARNTQLLLNCIYARVAYRNGCRESHFTACFKNDCSRWTETQLV